MSDREIKYLTPEEMNHIDAALNAAPDDEYSVAVQVIRWTGIRASELLKLKPTYLINTTKDQHALYIDPTKRSNKRKLPLPPHVWLRLKRYADKATQNKQDYIFSFTYKTLQRAWYSFSPESCRGHDKRTAYGLHSLRHTMARAMYLKCGDIKKVQQQLGHKSIDNTLVYMTYTPTADELRVAHGWT